MSALLDSLVAGFEGDANRRAQLDALLQDGLPPARSEAWKYTSLRQLERRSFAKPKAVAVDSALLAAIPSPRMVFVNGLFDAGLSDLTALPTGLDAQPLSTLLHGGESRALDFLERRYLRVDEPFARLNAALAREGAVLRVAAGASIEQPLHLVHVGTPDAGDVAWHLRHFIELREGASLTLVEHELADGDHAHLGNSLLHVHVANDASLAHARIQSAAPRATLFARTEAVLRRGTLVGAVLGAVLVNGFKSWLTGVFPEVWLFALGTLFIVVTLFLPRGIVGTLMQSRALPRQRKLSQSIAPETPVDENQKKLERAGA